MSSMLQDDSKFFEDAHLVQSIHLSSAKKCKSTYTQTVHVHAVETAIIYLVFAVLEKISQYALPQSLTLAK